MLGKITARAHPSSPLLKLHQLGQSYWLDNLSRSMITGGELKQRVEREDVAGVTSNPTIFQKAFLGSDAYDEELARLAATGISTPEIYERLTTEDVRNACDILRGTYEKSRGYDGLVSLEVSPHLARDAEASVEEARRLWGTVDRPNLLIKIPGTKQGVPAVEQLLREGISVNITLLFSIDHYEAVAEAYMRAQEARSEAGQPLRNINSVASFFLSRIDVLVDKLLQQRIGEESDPERRALAKELMGRAAVVNAKLAYQSFRAILETARWKRLAGQGAQPQRLLWASTSTKNPSYSDVRYVEPLIGPYTVNTMPNETIDAFADHGKAELTIEEDIAEARQVMEDLHRVGIDFSAVTQQLEDEGIQKFIEPYDAVMELIDLKCRTP